MESVVCLIFRAEHGAFCNVRTSFFVLIMVGKVSYAHLFVLNTLLYEK